MREHLEAVERISGKRPKELDGPQPPEGALYLWDWFTQLHNARGGGWGPAPISWEAIDAWARRMRVDPRPWELEVIREIDALYLRKEGERARKDKPQ